MPNPCRLAFLILALLLASGRLEADDPAAGDPQKDAGCVESVPADEIAAGMKALARLKQLGASAQRQLPESPCRERYLSYIQQVRYELPRPEDESKPHEVNLAFDGRWTGADEDLNLINSLFPLGKVHVTVLSFDALSPRGFSQLKLRQPLASLRFNGATDETFNRLSALPSCEGVRFQSWALSPAGWRRFAEIAGDLAALDCVGNGPYQPPAGITNDDLAAISVIPKLDYLRIYGGQLTPAGLKQVAEMKHLKTLILEHCPGLATANLAPLTDMHSLRRLELNFPVSAAAIANIARLDGLEELTIQLDEIKPAAVEPLGQLTNLRKLEVAQILLRANEADALDLIGSATKSRRKAVPLGNAIGQAVGKMNSLETLHQRVPMSAKGFEGLAGATRLRTLWCELVPLGDAALAPLARLTALRELRINASLTYASPSGRFSDAALAALKPLHELVVIEIPGRGLTDAGLTQLAELSKLQGLHLSGSKITGSGLAALGQLTALRSLSLENAPISDEGCRQLPQFPQLMLLDLNQTNVTDAAMEPVSEITNLTDLGIANTVVTDAGLAKLSPLKHLRAVGATHSDITEAGIAKFKALLPDARIHIVSAADRRLMPRPKPGPHDADEPLDLLAVDDEPAGEPAPKDNAAAKPRPPATQASAKKALERLKSLGADVVDEPDRDGQRRIRLGFSALWRGTGADLDLLDDLLLLGKIDASFDFQYVSPKALSKLKLEQPLDDLSLFSATDRAFNELKRLPSTRNITFYNWNLTPAGFRRLAGLAEGLESLAFSGFRMKGKWYAIGDADLAELAHLATLKELTIDTSPLTAAGVQSISQMKGLQRLKLATCPALHGADLSALGNLAALRKLELSFPLSAVTLAAVGRLGSLEELTFVMADSAPADVEPLGNLAHLRALSILSTRVLQANAVDWPPARIEDVPLGETIARIAAKMPDLETLIVHAAMSDKSLEPLAALEKLQTIGLNLVEVTDQTLVLASRLPKLRSLNLHGTGKLTDQGLEPIEHLTELTDLALPAAGLSDAAAAHLAPLGALKSLDLAGGNISGKALASLSSVAGLNQLGLADSAFDDADCRSLPRFAQLRLLNLSRSKITDAAMKSIAKLPQLTLLNIDGTKVTKAGFAYLDGSRSLRFVLARQTLTSDADFLDGGRNKSGTALYIFSDRPDAEDDEAVSEDAAAE